MAITSNVMTIDTRQTSKFPSDDNSVQVKLNNPEKDIGKISCSTDGSIEKYIGNDLYQILIPGNVMVEAVKIAMNKIKENDNA